MKKGDIVMIYEDPLTEKKPEGKAELLHLAREERHRQYWKVRFVDDGFVTYRFIRKEAA